MANVIVGHISGEYKGPAICDSFYGSKSATSCTGDCNHTVVVGNTDLRINQRPEFIAVQPDSFIAFQGASYDGPEGCTSGDNCRFDSCYAAEEVVSGCSLYVNPGQCVEINFNVSSRAYNVGNIACRPLVALTLQNATGPNLGVLTGDYWYSLADKFKSCCGQALSTPIYSPTGSGSSVSAYLSRRIFNSAMLSYLQDENGFCCPPSGSCARGSQVTTRITCGPTAPASDITETYARRCFYSSRTGCAGGTSSANQTVVAPEVVRFASYLYCADQPCGAKILFAPEIQFAATGSNVGAYVDDYMFIDIRGFTGCGDSYS